MTTTLDTATLEVARDAIADHRFDALPDIAEQSPEIRIAVMFDLARAVSALAADGIRVEIDLRDVPDVATLHSQLIAAGAVPDGVYREVTPCRTKNNTWIAAQLRIGDVSIDITSKFQPTGRGSRPRRKRRSP